MKGLLTFCFIASLLFYPVPSFPVTQQTNTTDNCLLTYTWYSDYDMTSYVATNTIANQISALQTQFPGAVFSSAPSTGLWPYLYGYYSQFSSATIYSDLD